MSTSVSPAQNPNTSQQANNETRAAQPAFGVSETNTTLKRFQRARVFMLIGAITLLAGGAWLYQQLTHIEVSDARIAADTVTISSRVAGRVTALGVKSGDPVTETTVLAQIDDRESRLLVAELSARLSGIAARRAEIETRIKLMQQQTQHRIHIQQAVVRAAEAAVASAVAQQDLALIENTRMKKLIVGGAMIPVQQDKTRTVQETTHQQVLMAQAALENAQATLAQAETAREEITVLEHQLAVLEAEEQQLNLQHQRMQLDLADRTIVMPLKGVVDQVPISVGEYVTPGQRLLMMHDPEQIWIDANVKETDIRFFTVGKAVRVTVDALPGEVFEGVVDRVGQAATSEFALLPNPNPSGNFTKITQRLPVRVAVPQQNDQLKPGMMVELEISTRG